MNLFCEFSMYIMLYRYLLPNISFFFTKELSYKTIDRILNTND